MTDKVLTPAQFDRLPKYKRVLLVAKDVLAQIKYRVYIPAPGNYVFIDLYNFGGSASLRDVLLKPQKCTVQCTVCLRGALFLSTVKFRNKLTIEGANLNTFYGDGDEQSGITKNVFSSKEQLLMERIFEAKSLYSINPCPANSNDLLTNACIKYAAFLGGDQGDIKHHPKVARLRLIGVMKNIIRNKGKFIIPKRFFK